MKIKKQIPTDFYLNNFTCNMKIVLWVARVVFGVVFILSGFFKLIDPLGFTYKLQDYLLVFGMEGLYDLSLPISIVLSIAEVMVGVGVIIGVKMQYTALAGLLFMAFFTPLTLYLALTDKVMQCGCFGDAIPLDGWSTFFKNIVLTVASILLFAYRKEFRSVWSPVKDWLPIVVAALLSLLLAVYCLRNLPIIDFLPWKVGNNIAALMVSQQEVSDIFLTFRNRETGELAEYPANDYPWDDPQWAALWEFVSQRTEVISAYVPAPINNFIILDEFQNDLTQQYVANPSFQFIVVAYDLSKTRYRAFREKINPLVEQIEQAGYSLIVLTSSSQDAIDAFRHHHQTPYRFYQSDAVALKTMIRSNPGMLLLKDGVVLGKWAHRDIPEFRALEEKYLR